ncbi:hypothetical protein GGI23_000829 [Coemansia sp. RSA 2559]|nr:hypothetical protein GGI23_000829 [Coemansia sp. RSA 2559]
MAGASLNNIAHNYQHHASEKKKKQWPAADNVVGAATSSSHTFGPRDSDTVPSGDSLASDTTTQAVTYIHVSNKLAGDQHNVGVTATVTAADTMIHNADAFEGNVGLAVAKKEEEESGQCRTTQSMPLDRAVVNDGPPLPHMKEHNGMHSEPPRSFSPAISPDAIAPGGHSGSAGDERNYVDRFGSYSDYLSIVRDSISTEASSSKSNQDDDEQQSFEDNSGLDNDNHIYGVHGESTAFAQQQQQQHQSSYPPSSLPAAPPPPPPLRSTYKSEPSISVVKQTPRVTAAKDVNFRNSYSRTLENALFYSQAVEQIRELDIADASNPYAAAMPRARPGKENIRQRRARNVTASREVFSIVNTGGSFMLEADHPPPLPDARLALERSRAMRSEPSFKPSKNGNASVPIGKLLPPPHPLPRKHEKPPPIDVAEASGCGEGWQDTAGEFQPRRAGLDQPVPLTDDGRAESVKQRGTTTPHTFSSSMRPPSSSRGSRQCTAHNATAVSDILGSENDDRDSSIISSPQTTSRLPHHRHRLSVVSYFSTKSAAPPPPTGVFELLGGVARMQKQDFVRPQTAVPGKRHQTQQQQPPPPRQLSSHSKKVATRLLMRAGLSSIAIRVARIGHGHAPLQRRQTEEGRGAEDAGEGFDTASVNGVELDPNGLLELKTERRKQVKHVDEFGFMEFEGDDARESEHTQQYKTWRAQKAGRSMAHRLERQLQVESAELHAGSDAKWETLLASFDRATLRKSRKVKRLVQAGVPQGMRGRFYYVLSGASAIEKRGEYARLLALAELPIFDVIERDVPRCYPDHVMFSEADGQGQRQLRRVLRAFAQHNTEIGYCQGMGRLVGLFLISGLSEEHAFWVLAAVIQNYIPQYYELDLGGLRVHTAAFEMMLQERNPRLHAHLTEQGCEALMYATPWFMTVFTLSLPWAAALRVWDWFVYRGPKVLFRVALGITDLASAYLLDACPTIAELLGFLLHIPRGLVEADMLVAAAMRVKLSERHIGRLTQEASSTAL